MNKEEQARKKFVEGCNCAQAVFATFAPKFGIDEEMALRMSSALGGGIGRLREVCGAFVALTLIVGLAKGRPDATPEEKTEQYKRIQELADKFKEAHGSLICRDILKLQKDAPTSPTPEKRTKEYYTMRPCERCVSTAALLAQELLENTKE